MTDLALPSPPGSAVASSTSATPPALSEDRATVLVETDSVTVHYSAPHPPRKASATYVRAHHDLIYVKLTPCWVCGLLPDHTGKFATPEATNETHHALIEESDFRGVDIAAVEADDPSWDWTQIDPHNPATFELVLDGEGQMKVICATHHRATRPVPDHRGILGVGIHHCPYPIWVLQRYQLAEYPLFVADDSRPFDPSTHLHPNHAVHAAEARHLARIISK